MSVYALTKALMKPTKLMRAIPPNAGFLGLPPKEHTRKAGRPQGVPKDSMADYIKRQGVCTKGHLRNFCSAYRRSPDREQLLQELIDEGYVEEEYIASPNRAVMTAYLKWVGGDTYSYTE